MQLGITHELPIRQRVARQDSKLTIVSCLDALVELITNSDDSYRRSEADNIKKSGIIDIFLKRKKGGICSEIWIRDYAEGISREKMQKVYPYGEKSSGIEKYSVRGYFGRGLKQSIIAFGEGEIHSFHNGNYSGIKIWWDNDNEKAQYQEIHDLTDEEKKLLHLGLAPCETLIIIRNKFDDSEYCIPAYNNFKQQLQNHFALRDIFSAQNRTINFELRDWKVARSEKNLRFTYPANYKKVLEETKVMEIYQWILRQNGFKVLDRGYFVYCRVNKNDGFPKGKLSFDIKVQPYDGNSDWVEDKIFEAKKILNGKIPEHSPECDYCKYVQAAK